MVDELYVRAGLGSLGWIDSARLFVVEGVRVQCDQRVSRGRSWMIWQ